MSRSGYVDNCYEWWSHIRWRGAVASALRGRRGQAFLREMLAALDALPEKKLIAHELVDEYDSNTVCAIGAVGRQRGVDLTQLDPEDHDTVAGTFGVAGALAKEIMYMNDEDGSILECSERRWYRMRAWIVSQIKERTP